MRTEPLRRSTRSTARRRLLGPLGSAVALLGAGCYQGVDGKADGDGGPSSSPTDTDAGSSGAADDDAGDDGSDGGSSDTGEAELPFDPLPAASALAKVKDFLTGLPPTAEEQAAYLADPMVLRSQVDGWMQTPEFEARAHEIFNQLFQQQVSIDNLAEYLDDNPNRVKGMNDRSDGRLLATIADAFSATAWNIVAESRPFHEVLTTRTFMLNVPQMVMLAWLDAAPRDDAGDDLPSWVLQDYDNFEVGVRWTGDPIPLGQTLNPNSPNFMKFWLDETPDADCVDALNNVSTGRAALVDALELLFRVPPSNVGCVTGPVIFTDADWALRPVTLRVAGDGEDPTAFFALTDMRDATELVLRSDRVGFFTTLGFSSAWLTNDSNQHRVTANQALIVGVGRTFDPENVFAPADGATIDQGHADPDTPCYGCHKDLDPLRDFLRQSYTYSGSRRPASMMADLPATAYFSIDGSEPVAGTGVGDLGAAMAGHERFAPAWAEKLCTLVNSTACDHDDPELERIAAAFADANFDFRTLVRELVTSPLVTFDARTLTYDTIGNPVLPVTQDRFCRRMSLRLGITDVCNLQGALEVPVALGRRFRALAEGVPPVSYGRTAVLPFVTTAPDVFSVASIERVCQLVAERWYGDGDAPLWIADDREAALDHMVGTVMGIPEGDARSAPVRALLSSHWDAAIVEGATPADALRSTFMTACASAPATSTAL